MLPSFLITIREAIEAVLLISIMITMLKKYNQTSFIGSILKGAISAGVIITILLIIQIYIGSILFVFFQGINKYLFEGILKLISSVFITWAVFYLHSYFASYKTRLLQKINKVITKSSNSHRALFILAFSVVIREGLEVIFFLTTSYITLFQIEIFTGIILGVLCGIFIAYIFSRYAVYFPIYYVYQTTSALLILFAAGLLTSGVHEFQEAGILDEIISSHFIWFPYLNQELLGFFYEILGISHHMDALQALLFVGYILFMGINVLGHNNHINRSRN